MRYARSYPNAVRPVPLLVRLEGPPTDDATRERIERQIREANRQWRLANAHIRARMV